MEIYLTDCTGAGTPDPARYAANKLLFAKGTRLEMSHHRLKEINALPWEKVEEEIEYIANTIPSSWEFINYSFLLTKCTRAFTHQFVRTRTASFAQQTMRVLNVHGWEYGVGPTIASNPGRKKRYDDAMENIAHVYDRLIEEGAAIEDARGVLPTNIYTNIFAEFNLRTLTEMSRKRASRRVQGEYREAIKLMVELAMDAHPWTSHFFERTFDKAAQELEDELAGLNLAPDHFTHLLKLLDQMRTA